MDNYFYQENGTLKKTFDNNDNGTQTKMVL